jgi:hypothetical protein
VEPVCPIRPVCMIRIHVRIWYRELSIAKAPRHAIPIIILLRVSRFLCLVSAEVRMDRIAHTRVHGEQSADIFDGHAE